MLSRIIRRFLLHQALNAKQVLLDICSMLWTIILPFILHQAILIPSVLLHFFLHHALKAMTFLLNVCSMMSRIILHFFLHRGLIVKQVLLDICSMIWTIMLRFILHQALLIPSVLLPFFLHHALKAIGFLLNVWSMLSRIIHRFFLHRALDAQQFLLDISSELWTIILHFILHQALNAWKDQVMKGASKRTHHRHLLAGQMSERMLQAEMDLFETEAEKAITMIALETHARQKQYHLENNNFQKQMQSLKDAYATSLRMTMDERYSNDETFLPSFMIKECRNGIVAKLAEKVKVKVDLETKKVFDFANTAHKISDNKKKEAEKKQVEAKLARQDVKRIEMTCMRRANLCMSSEKHVDAPQLAIDMVKSGKIDIDKLAMAAIGGKYVWVWIEDAVRFASTMDEERRFGSVTDPIILYNEKAWTKIEAHYLVVRAGGSSDFASIQVDAGTKCFAQNTGQLYTIKLDTMKQYNKSSGYERGIRRIEVEDLFGMQQRRLIDQRLKALNAAEVAFNKVTAAYRVADFEQNKAALRLDQAEEYLKKGCGSNAPHDLSGIGHEQIPMSWSDMNDKLYMEVELCVGDVEYQMVASFFSKTASNKEILSITRIQNVLLWGLFDRTREIVSHAELNNGNANEEYLWHGSRLRGALEKILVGGFDSARSRRWDNVQGIWLSTSSQYSTDYCYRQPDGTRKILLVRSILGYMGSYHYGGIGINKADSHHSGGTSVGHVRKDDQVGGGVDNRYVINSNSQIYPAYVLEFR